MMFEYLQKFDESWRLNLREETTRGKHVTEAQKAEQAQQQLNYFAPASFMMLRHLRKFDESWQLNLKEETCYGRYVIEGRTVVKDDPKVIEERKYAGDPIISESSLVMQSFADLSSPASIGAPVKKEFGIFHEAQILIDDADDLKAFQEQYELESEFMDQAEAMIMLEDFISDRAKRLSTNEKKYDLPAGALNTNSILEDLLPSLGENSDSMSFVGRLLTGAKELKCLVNEQLAGPEAYRERAAMIALSISKLHEDLGLVERRLAVIDEALGLWKFDMEGEEIIGGYTVKEAMAFHENDLKYIIQLKSQRSKASVNKACVANEVRDEVQCMNDALHIYKWASKSMEIKDRSIIFPVFSCLFLFIKTGEIKQDKDRTFEVELVRNFVQEAKLHGDPVHHTRALALEAELYSHLGKYHEALKVFETLELCYNVQYSDGISDAYGTDRSAQSYSRSALWQMQIGDEKGALEKCEYVITHILPNMNPRNVHNYVCLLYPIIGIMKDKAPKRMKELFELYIIENYDKYYRNEGANTPCAPMFDPLTLLLGITSDEVLFSIDPDLEDYISWAAKEENGVCSEFLDSIMSDYGWAPHTMTADMCLRLSKFASGEQKKQLIAKSRNLTSRVNEKLLNNEATVVLHAAFAKNERVRLLAMKVGRHSLTRHSTV